MTEQPSNSQSDRAPHESDDRPFPVLSNRAIIGAAVILILVGAGLAITLLAAFGNGQGAAQLDAIKTAGTIVIGTGGAAALWLTARRQRTNEIALNQKRVDQLAADRAFEFQQEVATQNRLHLERVAAATEQDAATRRLNDLYLKAVEQLGSDKSVVRLGALFALERVGNEDPKQRQTVVDVVCAYLRSPFTPASTAPRPLGRARPMPKRGRRITGLPVTESMATLYQERQVRVTAQRLLARVLRGADDHHNEERCWRDMNLDLIGATLIDLDFTHCSMHIAWFENVTFLGETWLNNTTFTYTPSFDDANFERRAYFDGANFQIGAAFRDVTFSDAVFRKAGFGEYGEFNDAKFLGDTDFSMATFAGRAVFEGAQFDGATSFEGAHFAEQPRAAGVEFKRGRPGKFPL